MAHRIAVVTGSPRVKGNSAMLAAAFIEGAQAAGCEVVRMDAGRAHINGCLGCEYCFAHEGACCQDDDMQEFYPLLRTCDTIVYVTPIYTFSWPAQIKAFIDRMFCGIAKPFGITQAGLLTCYEDKDASISAAPGQHLPRRHRLLWLGQHRRGVRERRIREGRHRGQSRPGRGTRARREHGGVARRRPEGALRQ